ncbi:hypothetical protein DY037_05765 [Apilactobacillus micheneri]|uniref:hypothetical protein n=1 Tax=Apilactobacillus micheneri TaxID=1899430 RepID=UPI0011271B6C|nr:hypothetical protein [Apilactobacillus micheneri]TPR49288.1 hypothetical protein DY037_05765 [Apilactobacillus micheneri]
MIKQQDFEEKLKNLKAEYYDITKVQLSDYDKQQNALLFKLKDDFNWGDIGSSKDKGETAWRTTLETIKKRNAKYVIFILMKKNIVVGQFSIDYAKSTAENIINPETHRNQNRTHLHLDPVDFGFIGKDIGFHGTKRGDFFKHFIEFDNEK